MAGHGIRGACNEVAAFGVKRTFKKILKTTWMVRRKQGVKEGNY